MRWGYEHSGKRQAASIGEKFDPRQAVADRRRAGGSRDQVTLAPAAPNEISAAQIPVAGKEASTSL
jgi:hypothetical protein